MVSAEQAGPADLSPAPMVVLDQVGKIFADGTAAVAGLDLQVGEREFISLLGPSGCGKSTVLRLIAGLLAPTSGRIDRRAAAARGEIGFVFQDPTLLPWASVFDNVYLPLRLRGQPRRTAAGPVQALLELVGLADVAGAYPRQLSGGMKMRVAIARALATAPTLLLLDEPFAALDEITRTKLNQDLLQLWQGHGLTVVFVTHSVYESVFLSSRIAVLSARPGRVIAELPIPAGYPRSEAFRTSEPYNRLCRQASAALREALGPAP
jgi:NitT/TauT family transport system ATP-binding protein